MKVVLIGSGNVATHLGTALNKSGHTILQVYSPTTLHASKLAKSLKAEFTTDPSGLHPKADLYLIALKDEAIGEILPFIPVKTVMVAHTSGSVSLSVFPKEFTNCGVIYPLQTFSRDRKIDIRSVPFCLECRNPSTKNKLGKLVSSLSEKLHWINSSERRSLHLAAVFANNFSNHMFVIAEEILRKSKLDFDLLRPLIAETAKKVQRHSPGEMQTGPARRGDSETIEKHMKELTNHPEYAKIYKLISQSIEDHNGPLL
ncbi:MAG: DUF2520 domain-containing protein [Bacteroidetes bacterium]|nr:DUF2520 domain-containing protein [Bacteroidota bacterium]